MPFYDRGCSVCNWRQIDVLEPVRAASPSCPECGAHTDRIWLSHGTNVIGDEIDIVQENGAPQPIHFRSRIERRRWLKEQGLREIAKNAGPDDKHCPRWVTMDAKTLENARELVSRASTFKGNDPPDRPMHITYVSGELPRD